MEEFRYLIRNDGDADIIIDKVSGLEYKPLMAASFRHSWLGVKDAVDKSDTLKRQGVMQKTLTQFYPKTRLIT